MFMLRMESAIMDESCDRARYDHVSTGAMQVLGMKAGQTKQGSNPTDNNISSREFESKVMPFP